MRRAFDELLGLPTAAALGVLAARGITDVEVVPTAAPPRQKPYPEDAFRTPEGEDEGYASTRVIRVEEDGRRLIVARFLTGLWNRD